MAGLVLKRTVQSQEAWRDYWENWKLLEFSRQAFLEYF
jgi:hypothetical protein